MFSFLGLIPALLTSAIQIVTPFIVAIGQLFIWWLKQLWEGIKDMTDNLGSIILVLSLCLATAAWTYTHVKCPMCPSPKAAPSKVIKPKPGKQGWWDEQKYGNLPPLLKPGQRIFG